MDEGGHRENGRHKTDQYKAAQGQVCYGPFFLICCSGIAKIACQAFNLKILYFKFISDANFIATLVVDAASTINETDHGHHG